MKIYNKIPHSSKDYKNINTYKDKGMKNKRITPANSLTKELMYSKKKEENKKEEEIKKDYWSIIL